MLFKELWVFDSPEEQQAAALLLRRFQRTIQVRAAARGWAVDSTADLARVLRPAGTLNRTNRSAQEIVDQVLLTRKQPGASGNIHFGFKMLLRNGGGMADALRKDVYSELALVPASPWLLAAR